MAKERNKNDSTPSIDRRALLAGSSALGAAALLPSRANAQAASTASPSMPAQGEFVVRGAYVISMDDKVGDFPTGDVHVRDGVIVAVAASVAAPARDAGACWTAGAVSVPAAASAAAPGGCDGPR